MKSTLTSADPCGWYEFACNSLGRQVAHWDGQYLRGGGCTFYQPNCRNFRRLFTESDVAALNEELRTLREELKNMTCKKEILMDTFQSAGGSIAELETKLFDLEKHKNCVLDHNHQLLQEVESLKQQLSDSESHKNQIVEIARRAENRHRERINKCWDEFQSLREELSRLKSQPYEMRRADRPDCLGIWLRIDGDRRHVRCVVTLDCEFSPGPWYYLGPIPVIVEQQPPKVVRVRCKKTGEVCRAIPRVVPGDALSYCLLNDDGTTKCFVTTNSVEEVAK